ncbi:hypothetical protein TeGR_g5514, partial [Tetraparma gracilis]
AIDDINSNPNLLPSSFLNATWMDSDCNKQTSMTALLSQARSFDLSSTSDSTSDPSCAPSDPFATSLNVLIGDGCSANCEANGPLTEFLRIPTISFGCSADSLSTKESEDSSVPTFPNFMRTLSPKSAQVQGVYDFVVDTLGASKIATLTELDTSSLFSGARDNLEILGASADGGEPTLAVEDYTYSGILEPSEQLTMIRSALGKLKKSGVRVWAPNGYAEGTRRVLKEARKLGMCDAGYQILMFSGVFDCILANPKCPSADGAVVETDEDLLYCMRGSVSFFQLSKDGALYEGVSGRIGARMGIPPEDVSVWAYTLYESVYLYAYAAHTFILGDPTDKSLLPEFLSHLRSTTTEGVTGPLKFKPNGDRDVTFEYVNMNYGSDYLPDPFSGLYWSPIHHYSESLGIHQPASSSFASIVYTGGATSPPPDTPIIPPSTAKSFVDKDTFYGIAAGAAAVVILIVIFFTRRVKQVQDHEKVMQRQGTVKEKRHLEQIATLSDKLDMLMGYGENEKDLIHALQEKLANGNNAQNEIAKVMIRKEDIEALNKIGQGSFGDVIKASYRGTLVAVKTMRNVDEENIKNFKSEISLM